MEWTAAVAVTVLVVVLHLRFFAHAGPLWRDEVSTVELANLPTIHDYVRAEPDNSFPRVWGGVLRAWQRVGPGNSDRRLRALGLLVGLATVGILWSNARSFGARSPLASLVVLELCPMAVCYGDSLRAYGAGVLTGLISTGAIFRFTQSTARRPGAAFAVAGIASLVSVHTLFYNSAWLLGACVAGAAVCVVNGRRLRAAAVLGMGGACGATLAIYLPMIRGRAEFAPMFMYPTPLSRVWSVLTHAVAETPFGQTSRRDTVAIGLVVAAVAAACLTWATRRPGGSPADRRRSDAAAFCLGTLLAGVPAYLGLLMVLKYTMLPFYFLALLALVASCLDGLWAVVWWPGRRLLLTAGLCVMIGRGVPDAWASAGMRMSNVDGAAERLRTLAAPGDLIVLTPYWLSSPFFRYYHGPVELLTVPPVVQPRYQAHGLFVRQLRNPQAMDPLLARVAAVARAGHQVWVVQEPGNSLNWNPTAPLHRPPPTDWHDPDFIAFWNLQLSRALREDFGVMRGRAITVDSGGDINPLERVQVLQLRK